MFKQSTILLLITFCALQSCKIIQKSNKVNASEILGNNKYKAICYGGYRTCTRNNEPTLSEIKDDLKILSALNIKIVRTYNVHFNEIKTLLQAIDELKKEKSTFEMYVMLGIWIDCKNAWTTKTPIHSEESERNQLEVLEAVALANKYPDIIKIISVGNEAMVHWATSYYVTQDIILKWVNYLQDLKKQNQLSKNIWITSSDNYASWGGGDSSYHSKNLIELIKAVDYISLHTYPMHDTYYNPVFWGVTQSEENLNDTLKIENLMERAKDYAIQQYYSVSNYLKSLGITKPIHIGETGWSTVSNDLFGKNGTNASDEYKSALYYKKINEWTTQKNITCFYFEAFDECWKNSENTLHSENHFGLINLNNEVKYVLWSLPDNKVFKDLTRNGKPLTKTYNGNFSLLWQDVMIPKKEKN